MKSAVALLLIALVAVVSGFSVVGPQQQRSAVTSLDASRNRDKIASRTKWLESRGFGGEGGATVAEPIAEAAADEDEEESADDQGETEGEEESAAEE